MKRLFLLPVIILFFGTVACGADAGGSVGGYWPQWRGPNRDGHSSETGLLKTWETKKPALAWNAKGLGSGYASVSIAKGTLYTMGDFPDGQAVVAISAADGKVVWKRPLTDAPPKHSWDGSRCTPTIDGDNLYVVPSDGQIVCLKQADGAIVWRKDFRKEWDGKMMSGWGFSESPLVDGPWVLCTPGGRNATIVALDKTTGAEVWRSAVPKFSDKPTAKGPAKEGAGYSSIVVSNAAGVKQYVQLIGYGAVGIRATDGKFLWGYGDIANGTANIPTPIVTGDYVFVSTGYQTGSALLKLSPESDGVKAEEVYFLNAKTLQNHHGGMILVDGYMYCGHAHNQGYPICVELKTGKVMWGGERGPGGGSAAVTYADGNLIFRYQKGEVALIEATPKELRLKGVFEPAVIGKSPCWAHPVVAGGKLYLRDQDHLMCYDLKAEK